MRGSFSAPVRCIVEGCTKTATTNAWAIPTYTGRLCNTHKSNVRRNGDPLQKGIDKRLLRTLIRYVRDVVKQDATGKLEAGLKQVQRNLHDAVLEVCTDLDAGRPVPRWTGRGARQVLAVLEQVDPIESAALLTSLFLLRVEQPHRFVSQRGFEFCLVRLFRKQLRTAFGSYWHDARQQVVLIYSELHQHTVEQIAALLVTAYSRFASKIVARFTAERYQALAAKVAINEGIDATIPRQPFAVCQSPPCTTLLPLPRHRRYCSKTCRWRAWYHRYGARVKAAAGNTAVTPC
jgi:hypothetical protein